MQTIIKNNTLAYLDTESIQEQVNSMRVGYMNTNIQILKATVTQPDTTDDRIIYELLIWDSSEEPIKGTPEEYLDEISAFQDYAADCYYCNSEAKIEILSKEEKLSKITLTLTF